MIGYINPYKEELKFKHLNFYNSLYCSLCFNIKKYNNLLRFFLPKDIIFFYLLFISTFENINYNFTKKKCPINPFKSVNLYNEDKFFKLFCEISLLIISLKIYDFIYDNKVIIIKKLLKFFINKTIKKLSLIKTYFPEPQNSFKEYFYKEKLNYELLLNSLDLNNENEKEFFEIYFNNIENYFSNFNYLFLSIFPFDYLNSNISILIKNITQNITKIVILADSINDFYKDLKKDEDNILFPIYLYFFINQNNYNNKYKLIKENIKDNAKNYINNKKLKKIKKLLYKNFDKDIFNLVIQKIKPLLNMLFFKIKEEYTILKSTYNKNLYNEELLDNYIYFGIDFLINQTLFKTQKIK